MSRPALIPKNPSSPITLWIGRAEGGKQAGLIVDHDVGWRRTGRCYGERDVGLGRRGAAGRVGSVQAASVRSTTALKAKRFIEASSGVGVRTTIVGTSQGRVKKVQIETRELSA